MWVTCALGPYNFEFMTEVQREIMSRYRVDGDLHQSLGRLGHVLLRALPRRTSKPPPASICRAPNDPQDPARRAYILWRQQRLFDLWRLWDAEVRKINPDSCVIPNTGGGATSSLDMKRIGELAPIALRRPPGPPRADAPVGQRQERQGVSARRWAASRSSGIFSVGVEEPYRWKDSVQSEAEIRIWVADGIANGLRPWFTKFSGTLHDQRWLGVVEELYRWHHRVEKYLRNEAPLARVGPGLLAADGLVLRRPEAGRSSRGPRARLVPGARSRRASRSRWCTTGCSTRSICGQFKTLILPNIAALSDEQCRQLRAFVERGGSLVATYETSLYDEWGARRKDFGLADLFGVSFRTGPGGPMRNAYSRLEHDPRTEQRHPLLAGLEDAPRIIHGVYRLDVQARSAVRPPAAHADPELSRPADGEGLSARGTDRRSPRSTCARSARGRVVYFPWDIDRIFWEVLGRRPRLLLRNAVALGDERRAARAGHRARACST